MQQYIAVSPGYYGSGESIEEAKANLKKFGGTLQKVVVYELPEHANRPYVTDMDTIRWSWAPEYRGPHIVHDLKVVHKRGVKPN